MRLYTDSLKKKNKRRKSDTFSQIHSFVNLAISFLIMISDKQCQTQFFERWPDLKEKKRKRGGERKRVG